MGKTRAYTLIELVVVVGLILVMAVLTAPALAPMLRRRALSQGAMTMQAALVRARAAAIAQEPDLVPVMPVCVRAQPPRWGVPTAMEEWFGKRVSTSNVGTDEDYPQYDDSGTMKVKYADGSNTVDTTWSQGGAHDKCWRRKIDGSANTEHVYGFIDSDGDERMQVADGDILGMWAYVTADVEGFGFTVYADDENGVALTDETATAYWGTGITTAGTWPVNKGEIPQRGKWVQVAASVRELGMEDDWYLKGLVFRVHDGDGNGDSSDTISYVFWDRVVLWKNAYMLPDFIVPDTSQFPVEFEKDGRLKACRVEMTDVSTLKPVERDTAAVHWFDRLIILKDVRDRELQEYLEWYDEPTGYGGDNDGFWECEAFTDASGGTDGWVDGAETYWDYGLDRVKGTSDTGESDTSWDFEGEGAGLTEPDVVPNGQIYLKINKITGMTKTCAHPGE